MRSFDIVNIVNIVICQTGFEQNGEGKVTDPKPQGSPRERCQARAHEDEADDQPQVRTHVVDTAVSAG